MTDVVKITKKDSDFNTFLYDNSACQQQKSIMVGEGIFEFNEELKVAMERHYDAFILFRWYIQSYTNFLNTSVNKELFDYIFSKVDFDKCMKTVVRRFIQSVPYYCFPKQSSINSLHQKWLMEITERIEKDKMLNETSFCLSFSNILIKMIEKEERTMSPLTMKYLSLLLEEDNCLFYTNHEIVKCIFYLLKRKYTNDNSQRFVDDYITSFIKTNVRRLYEKDPIDFNFNAKIVNKFVEFLDDEEIEKINSIRTLFELKGN